MTDDNFRSERSSTVNATFTLSSWDIFRASYAILHRRPQVWIVYAIMVLGPVIMVLVTILGAADIDPDDFLTLLCLAGACPGSFSAVCLVSMPLLVWLRSLAILRAPSTKGPQRFRAHAEGITVTTAVVRSQLNWPAFAKVVETKGSFLFFVSRGNAVVVPRRSFPALDDRRELRQVIRAGLGDKAYLRAD